MKYFEETKSTAAHPSSKNLINGRRLLQRALVHDLWPHLLHKKHEGVEGLLDVSGLLEEAMSGDDGG